MLPLPGSPSATWAMYRARLASLFHGADPKVCVAFWLFGLINNVLYVIILTAALDLVGPDIPKAVVLLATILPALITKMLAPTFLHKIAYSLRILGLTAQSIGGMLLVALTPGYTDLKGRGRASMATIVGTKMTGVALASISSAAGEVTFLGLIHFYGPFSLAGWGSGTGAAGLVGAGAYSVATTGWGFTSRGALFASAFFPLVLLVAFFLILPRKNLKSRQTRTQWQSNKPQNQDVGDDNESGRNTVQAPEEDDDISERDRRFSPREEQGLLAEPQISTTSFSSKTPTPWLSQLRAELYQLRSLFFPYMLPLLLVYFAEYTINLGILPTVLFPLSPTSSTHGKLLSSPSPTPRSPHLPSFLTHYRDFYPTYNTIYQTGVFISRSSTPFIRIHNLYLPSLLQVLNLALLMAHALAPGYMIPDNAAGLWIVFALVFWEGLLGGGVYVNTFAEIRENVEPAERREWSLGAVSVSDSAGIAVAGFVSLAVETGLCGWQVKRWKRDYCKRL